MLHFLKTFLKAKPVYHDFETLLFDFLSAVSEKQLEGHCERLGCTPAETKCLLELQGRRPVDPGAFQTVLREFRIRYGKDFPLDIFVDEKEMAARPLDQIVKGKKVILTGPGDYVQGTGRGSWVESFDIVVRVNFQWPLPAGLRADLGQRIDVLYHCCNLDFSVRDLFQEDFAQLKCVCAEQNAQSGFLKKHCRGLRIPFQYTSPMIKKINEQAAILPSTGLTAICDLLESPLAELHVFGMTFWSSACYDGYKSSSARKIRRTGNALVGGWHDPAGERHFVCTLIEKDTRLKFDSAALQIMKLGLK